MVGNHRHEGVFNPVKTANHTHEGSIGNLCNDKIAEKFSRIYSEFDKSKVDTIKAALLGL